jgi:hypothetical protein|tara:strand:+ start:38 stop:259 length:222 start_codon:yes stop_codon:yes gene_type:complete
MKTVTIEIDKISQGQWSTFLLELNIMKKAWKSYGVDVTLKAPSIKKIITLGNSRGDKAINPKRKKNHIVNIFG